MDRDPPSPHMDYPLYRDIMTLTINYNLLPFLFLVFVSRLRKCLCPITTGIIQRHVLAMRIIVLVIILGVHLPEQIEMRAK